MNTLNNENIIYVPNTLDGENIVSSHLEENALLIDGTNQMLANLNAGNHRVTHVSNAISATDAVNKSQLDLKADTTYVDTNFLNKVTSNTQNVSSRLTFNNATSGSSFPIIELQNTITGSNNGMYLRFFKNFNRLANTEIGSIVFADKNVSSAAINRAVQLTASIDSALNPLLNITFNSGVFNPLTISDTQTILRCDDFYIKNKTTAQNLLYYTSSNDFWAMSKSLNMSQNNITNVGNLQINNQIDMTNGNIINLSSGTNANDAINKSQLDLLQTYLDTNFINKTTTSTQDVKGKLVFDDISDDIITFENDLATASNGMRLLFKNTRRMVEMAVSNDGSTQPVFQMLMNTGSFNPLTINTTQSVFKNKEFYFINQQDQTNILSYLNSTNKIKMYKELDCANITSTGNLTTTGNVSCVDLTTTGNQICGTNSTNTLDVKSTTSFEADVLIETNKHLAFNSGTLSTTNGMLMNFDGGVGFLDVRGSEFRVRTASSGTPSDIRFKVNDTNTTVRNNFFCDANSTFGNENTDTATFNSKITIHNILTFATGSRVDGARVQLIKSGNISYTMTDNNVENGVLCNNSSTISITMPAKSPYWNNRCYFVKVRTATVNLVQNTDTRIDDDESTLVMSSDFRGYLLQFDSDYENNGDIWRLCQI